MRYVALPHMLSPAVLLRLAVLLLAALLSAAPLEAQLPSRIKKKVKERVERAQDRAIDRALDTAEGAVNCVVTDQACIDDAEKSGKPVVLTDQQGQPLPAERQPPASQPPGTGAWANYDFVPGERVLLFSDFSEDKVGDFPRRLEFESGTMEIVQWENTRWLRLTTVSKFLVPLPAPLPERYTVEFDFAVPAGEMWIYPGTAQGGYIVFANGGIAGVAGPGPQARSQHNATLGGKVARARIMADGRYIKLYINEKRLANVPNFDAARTNKILFHVDGSEEKPALFGNFRIAAGGRKLYDALAAEGRVATQGIYFATGSDQLRPESTPVLKEIAAMLQEHPELKLLIEGHTDNVGDDAANLALSDKRAAAVKTYLIERSGSDASRLEAKGFGESKSVASNDTPEGRQQNRRVELVRR